MSDLIWNESVFCSTFSGDHRLAGTNRNDEFKLNSCSETTKNMQTKAEFISDFISTEIYLIQIYFSSFIIFSRQTTNSPDQLNKMLI